MTEQTSNPELFDLYCAKIFDYLFEHFPIKKTLNGETFTGDLIDSGDFNEEFNISDNLKIFSATVIWLIEENYIRYDRRQTSSFHFYDVALSHKALTAMKRLPGSISSEDKRTVADLIKEAVKTGSDQAIKTSVATLLTMPWFPAS